MINSVRNTVLAILNKNNYGYLSPSDFNLFAKQAQLDIFDEYFIGYNNVINKESNFHTLRCNMPLRHKRGAMNMTSMQFR